MATKVVYMNPVFISQYETQPTNVRAWDYKSDALAAPGDGDAVLIPPGSIDVQVSLIPTTGSGKIQATYDPYADVLADPDAVNWVDWSLGVVSVATQQTIKGPAAVRQVNATGSTIITVIVHK